VGEETITRQEQTRNSCYSLRVQYCAEVVDEEFVVKAEHVWEFYEKVAALLRALAPAKVGSGDGTVDCVDTSLR
jgi:hypothetical protein